MNLTKDLPMPRGGLFFLLFFQTSKTQKAVTDLFIRNTSKISLLEGNLFDFFLFFVQHKLIETQCIKHCLQTIYN